MTGEDRGLLLARIDAAISRIEAAVAKIPATDGKLERQHLNLRGAVAEALRELDGIIEEQQG